MPAPMNSSATSASRITVTTRHDGRDHPLQLILHAELGEAIAGMQDQRDHRGADAVEDGGHRLEIAEMDVERAQVRRRSGSSAG